jgi:hypothetical protein
MKAAPRALSLSLGCSVALLSSAVFAQGAPPAESAPASATPAPADPNAAAPAPAEPAAPAQDDSWSQMIKQGQQQERQNETDEERDRRKEREEREARAGEEERLRKISPNRSRTSLVAWLGLGGWGSDGLDYHSGSGDSSGSGPPPADFDEDSFQAKLGPVFHFGAGVRVPIDRNFDFSGRAGLSYSSTGGDCAGNYYDYDNSTYVFFDCLHDTSGLGATLQATLRFLPQLYGPRFYVGLGPHFQRLWLTSTISTPGGTGATAEVDTSTLVFQGMLELGMILGADEAWDVNLATSLGMNTQDGDAVYQVLGTVGRSFFF